jgi:signal transduction histidine kinase
MTAGDRFRTLPLRRWLALALLAAFLVPVCVTVAFVIAAVRQEPRYARGEAVERLRDGAVEWSDPAWQERTRAELTRDDVAFVLYVGGAELYRSDPDPFAGAGGNEQERVVERVEVPGSEPEKVAFVYADQDFGPPDEVPIELLPIVGVTALGLTLGGIGWFLGRTVLRPLSATSGAARHVAGGDLDIRLPRSRVREVDEVNTAFESMSVALDRSLRQQAELEEERRLFIGAIAHDLRTPLFALRGYLEGLDAGVADTPEKRTHYVAVAREKADTLERLINDLFDFTRLEYLEQAPERDELDLAGLLRKVADDMRPLAEANGIAVAFDLPMEGCHASGDAHLLTRAIENLIDNALRYTSKGGRVTIGCHATQEGVAFTIADTGPGIPPADLPHLFTPLFRGESSRNRRTGGAGLGLTIARRILLAHGGDLTAANRPEGGAHFTGTVPKITS